MSYQIHVTGTHSESSLIAPAEQACVRSLEYAKAPSGIVGIVLTDDTQIQELNRQYRSLDEPTDVLAFQMNEPDPETGTQYLGDVIISIPTTRSQAESAGHGLIPELSLLVVHGTLHLLGYDHASPADQERMWDAQSAILERLGINTKAQELDS